MDPTRLLNPQLSHAFAEDREGALKKTILPAVKKEDGNLSAIARTLGISVDTLRRWASKEPKLRKAIDDARVRAIRGAP